ncbi:hypothetical protein JZ751_005230 [Albula glossodonta]|uniref:SH3 domain-binding glutamic acid-rich-like protein 3 n=1 Tax=Albula glossodonta TaxID=121402 RepID=A0A8T2PDT3_9TELE|nr:hypothetical protein JZ751_005230 [Albula glossodonta]
MSIIIYYTSVSSNLKIKQNQQQIFMHLDSKKIQYKTIDISTDSEVKDEMRRKVNDPTALPPQIFNGDVYCGDYDKFFEAVEAGNEKDFFKL